MTVNVDVAELLENLSRALAQEMDVQHQESASWRPLSSVTRNYVAGTGVFLTVDDFDMAREDSFVSLRVDGSEMRAEVCQVEAGQVTLRANAEIRRDASRFEVRASMRDYLTHIQERLTAMQTEECHGDLGFRLALPIGHPSRSQKDLTYVIGPPGSGKSWLLAQRALSLVEKGQRVLVVCYTNSAADNIFARLADRAETRKLPSIVRYGLTPNSQKTVRDFRSPKVVASMELETLEASDIIVSTAHRVTYLAGKPMKSIDAVFIDEASKMPLPLAVIAGQLARVLVQAFGDPFQLGPIARAKRSSETGASSYFGSSVFDIEGVIDAIVSGEAGIVLTEQHRLPEPVCRVSFPPAYQNLDLSFTRSDKRTDLPWGSSHIVYSDSSQFPAQCRRPLTQGRVNGSHVPLVVEAVRLLLEQGLIDSVRPDERLLILTPYRAQRKLIREMLEMSDLFSGINLNSTVTTIHQAQGTERDFVILDTTDGRPFDAGSPLDVGTPWKGVGWSSHGYKLLAVALTRSTKQTLVVLDREFWGKPFDPFGVTSSAMPRLNGLLNSFAEEARVSL